MHKQDVWEHKRRHIDMKRKEIRNQLYCVGDIWVEVWGIRNSCTKAVFLEWMPSHVLVGGHPQWRGDSVLEGTEHGWGWHPEATVCKRSHTPLDPKRCKKGLLRSAAYTQSLARSRSSINLCATNEQPRVLSTFTLVCKKKRYESKILAVVVGLYYSFMVFWYCPRRERLGHVTAVPIHFPSFLVESPVLPLPAITDWSDSSLVVLVRRNICVKHGQGSDPLKCSFRWIHCDIRLIRGASNIFGG